MCILHCFTMLGKLYLLAAFSAIFCLGESRWFGRSSEEESLDSLSGPAAHFREFLRQVRPVVNSKVSGPAIGPTPSFPFELDDAFLKYAFGLAPGPTKEFDPVKLAGAYLKLFKVFKDADVITAQFTKAIAINVLRTRQTCVSGKAMKFIMVDIASMLQYDLRSIHEYIRPVLEALIPELRTSPMDIADEIPKVLDSLVIRHVLKQLARSLFPETFIRNLAKAFRDELIGTDDATTPETFGKRIDKILNDSLVTDGVAICPKLENIATALKTTLPKIPKAITDDLVTIVVQLRRKLYLNGGFVDVGAMEDLFDLFEYQMGGAIGFLASKYGSGFPGDIRDVLYYAFGIDLPRDLSEPPTGCDSLPVLLIREKVNNLVGFEGALKDIFVQLESRLS